MVCMQKSIDYHDPAVLVLFVAVLDSAQLVVECGADGTGFAIGAVDVAFLFVEVVDLGDGAYDSCRAAFACLFEGRQFLLRDLSAFDRQAHVFGQLLEAFVGYGR